MNALLLGRADAVATAAALSRGASQEGLADSAHMAA